MFGDPDRLHAYSYTPDVARGLAVLGTHEEAFGKVWHLPAAHRGTTRQLVERFAAALGSTRQAHPFEALDDQRGRPLLR